MIGYRILSDLLQDPAFSAYTIRCAVRNTRSFQKLISLKPVRAAASRIETVLVTDLTNARAYDEAICGAEYVLHVASPLPELEPKELLPTDAAEVDFDKLIVTPAIKGTVSILQAALKEPKVKRVVITSSIAAYGFPRDGVVLNGK